MNAGITFGLLETTVDYELARVLTDRSVDNEVRYVTVTMAVSPINGLVLHSAIFGGMNAVRGR